MSIKRRRYVSRAQCRRRGNDARKFTGPSLTRRIGSHHRKEIQQEITNRRAGTAAQNSPAAPFEPSLLADSGHALRMREQAKEKWLGCRWQTKALSLCKRAGASPASGLLPEAAR